MATDDVDVSKSYDVTENDKKRINHFLVKDLYETELKFIRPTAEVECIINGVNNYVEQLMTAVGKTTRLFEISHYHLVGSMAEGTSILEPNEFDFLFVLKQFSKAGAISFDLNIMDINKYFTCKSNIDQSLYYPERFNENGKVRFERNFMSNILKEVVSVKREPLYLEHGQLTIKSTTVCHHGPASVVKLLWEPKSARSKPLDILIDITPCIEQMGIHKVIKSDATKMSIFNRYESTIMINDTFMMIPLGVPVLPVFKFDASTQFEATITTSEVEIVKTLSSHHKTCYRILKYCFDATVQNDISQVFHTIFPSYCIKTFILRHMASCKSSEKCQGETDACIFTCMLDIINDLKLSLDSSCVAGIFGTYEMPRKSCLPKTFTIQVIENVIRSLVEIGKKGYSVDRHENFRTACHRTSTHRDIQERTRRLIRDNLECHLSIRCQIHKKYDLK